jgi:hypothetical protein
MTSASWGLMLVELVLVFGGVLLFGWWQLRDVERAQMEAEQKRARDRDTPHTQEPEATAKGKHL